MFYMQEDSFNMSSVEVEQSHAMPIMFDYALSITFAVSNMNASLITFPALRSYEPAVNLISIASTLDFSALSVFLQKYLQSRSQSPRTIWSAPRHGALE